MISRNELKNIVAEKADVAQPDADYFFEIFLFLLTDEMKAGEVFRFEDVGYFHLRKGMVSGIERRSAVNDTPVYLMLFTEQKELTRRLSDIHLFVIPDSIKDIEEDIDSHFSTNLGKPLSGESLKIWNSPDERTKYYSSKAGYLISSFLKNENILNDEDFMIDSFDEQASFRHDNTAEGTDNSNINFDENILNRLSRGTLNNTRMNINSRNEEMRRNARSLPWDFAKNTFDRKVDYPEKDEQGDTGKSDKDSSTQADKMDNDKINNREKEKLISGIDSVIENIRKEGNKVPEETNKSEVKEKDFTEQTTDKVETEKIGNYERVKAFISHSSEENPKTKPAKLVDKKNKTDFDKKSSDKNLSDDFIEVKSKSEAYHLREKTGKWKKNKGNVNKSLNQKYRPHRRSVLPFIIIFSTMAVVAVFLYLYLNSESIFSSGNVNLAYETTRPKNLKIIERDYELPVTFPYSKPEKYTAVTGIDLNISAGNKNELKEETNPVVEKPKDQLKTVLPEKETPVEVEKNIQPKSEETNTVNRNKSFGSVEGNVYKYKDYYVVQVSSFREYDDAQKEADKFVNLGYNAFVEIAEVPGSGTWYRVRVGDFTSEKQAVEFENKYK